MKILLTGAAGHLGRAVRTLLKQDHELRLLDVKFVESRHQSVQGDVREPLDVERAAKGVDVILHTAWLSPGSLRRKPELDFFRVNVAGTFNALRAATRHNIPKVVVCGSLAADDTNYAWSGAAGWTASAAEEMCRYYSLAHGIDCIFLRTGNFNRYRDYTDYGVRLLRRGVDRRDVAAAAALAVEAEVNGFISLAVASSHRLGPSDAEAYRADPVATLARRYPESEGLLPDLPLPDDFLKFDLEPARRVIGYEPHYTFGTFLRGLREKQGEGA